MSKLAPENSSAKHSTEMNGDLPSMYDNHDYGKKRKARSHKFTVKDTNNGNTYWIPSIKESNTFAQYLIQENSDAKLLDKITTLPEMVISQLKKLIGKGAKDLEQNWEDAKELVDTAYHVLQVRRPVPDQKGAWKQYTDLLRFGVEMLWKARGNKGEWRSSKVMYGESTAQLYDINEEQVMSGSRFFVSIPNAMDVEIEADDLKDAVRELINKLRRHGATAEVSHMTREGAVLTVYKKGEPVEEIIIKDVS